jgi:hypothetical protein
MTSRPGHVTAAVVLLAALAAGCGGGGHGTDRAATSPPSPPVSAAPAPGEFTDRVDNPWLPWVVGTRWRFVGHTADGVEHTLVTVTRRKRVVQGVSTTVVHDVVHRNGSLLEDTFDWYAQDADGNVWYFGEDTKEYDGGKVDTSGSWEAGVDGAKPGVVMLAHPVVGASYRQEYLAGEAEDQARVLARDASATVPFGRLSGLLETKDFTRLEPTADEHKFYAKGVGVVLEVSLQQKDRTELVGMTKL